MTHNAVGQRFHSLNAKLELQLQQQNDSFDIRLRDKKRELQQIQARAIGRKDLRYKKMQMLVCEKRIMITELTQDVKANSRQTTNLLKSSMAIREKTIEQARQRDRKQNGGSRSTRSYSNR